MVREEILLLLIFSVMTTGCGGAPPADHRPVMHHAEDTAQPRRGLHCRVVAEGRELGPATLASPAVTTTPDGFAAAWIVRQESRRSIRIQSLSRELDLVGEAFDIDLDEAMPVAIELSYCAGQLVVAWQRQDVDGDLIQSATLAPRTGHLSTIVTASRQGRQPTLACAGARAALAWSERRRGLQDLYLAWLDEQGRPSDAQLLSGETGAADEPDLACTDGECALVWSDGRFPYPEIFGVIIEPEREEPPESHRVSTHAQGESGTGGAYAPSIAAGDGERFLVAWHDSRSGDESEIYAATLSSSGHASAERRVSRSPSPSTAAVVASCGDGHDAVAWRDRRAGPPAVAMAALDRRGRRNSSALNLSGSADETSRPRATCSPDRSSFIIAWTQTSTSEEVGGADGSLHVVEVRCE